MYSVMLLITSFGALAGLYVLLDAPFTAVTQIIIYAGAIMVLFLFVVMLLNVPREDRRRRRSRRCSARPACGSASCCRVLLGVEVVWALSRVGGGVVPQGPSATSVSSVAAHRRGALHASRVRVRSDVDSDPGRDGRRRHPGAEGSEH